jgi:hypothetical protein
VAEPAPLPDLPVVEIRLKGEPRAVGALARRLRSALRVVRESPDYPNRREDGVRRYLHASVAPERGHE